MACWVCLFLDAMRCDAMRRDAIMALVAVCDGVWFQGGIDRVLGCRTSWTGSGDFVLACSLLKGRS